MSAVDECVVGQGGDLRQRLGHCHVNTNVIVNPHIMIIYTYTHVIITYKHT